jgi:type IV pilus modification protein PilV
MKTAHRANRPQGFSLLEVLVAIAILSFGLLALASLQITLMRTSSDAKARTVALSLAKDQLETMRDYSTLAGYQGLQDGTDTPAAIGGVTFTRTWEVTRYVFEDDVDNDGIKNEAGDQAFQATADTTAAETGATPAGFVANNEFKRIAVSVTWEDSTGTTQTVAIEDATGAVSPSDAALIAKLTSITTRRTIPMIINDPAFGESMVIPIALGNGVNSAATNPKPQQVVGTSTVATSFDVFTYSALNSVNHTANAQSRVETLMIGCTCDYGAAPSDITLRGKRPSYWDGFKYSSPKPATYAIPAGISSAQANNQSDRCTICCRDHHDPVGATGATFSPRFVTKSGNTVAAGGAHPHYTDKNAVSATLTGTYKEACRLIRVDGIFRVAADLENDYFGLLATGNGTTALTPAPDANTAIGTPPVTGGAVKRYQNFVVAYMEGRFIPGTPPSNASASSVYNAIGTPATLAADDKYVLDSPATIDIALHDATGKWLHSRGLYVDFVEQETIDAITQARQNEACNVSTATMSVCILKLLPFTSINLTELADWTPPSGPLIVTNLDYSTSKNFTDPVRGKVTTNTSTDATILAQSLVKKYNTGLLDLQFDAISATDDIKATDGQSFVVGGGSPGEGTQVVTVVITYAGTSTPSLSYFVNGSLTTTPCNGVGLTKTCSIPVTSLGVNGGVGLEIGNFNHQQNTSAQTSPVLTGCVNSGQGLTATLDSDDASNAPGTPQPYTGSVCKNYGATSGTVTVAPAGSFGTVTVTQAATSTGDGDINPIPGEVQRIEFSGSLNAGDTVTINLGTAVPTVQTPSSCTYVCDTLEPNNGPPYTGCKSNKPTYFSAVFPTCP